MPLITKEGNRVLPICGAFAKPLVEIFGSVYKEMSHNKRFPRSSNRPSPWSPSVGNILHIKSERNLLTHGFAMAFGLGCILRAVQLIV